MLIWEKAGTAGSDGHSPICVPGPRSPETCMARVTCGAGPACSPGCYPKNMDCGDVSPLRDTPEFERGYEKEELNPVKAKNCCTHWDLLDGGYALGLLFQGLWWPLNIQKLRELPLPPLQRLSTNTKPQRLWITCMHDLGGFVSNSFSSHLKTNDQDKILTIQPV